MRCTTIYLVCFTLAAGGLLAQSGKLSSEFGNVDPASNVRVIVSYSHTPTDSDHQRFINEGGTHHGTFHSIAGANYTVPASSLARLATDSGVTHISIDHPIAPKLDYVTAATNLTSVAGSLSAAQKYGVTGAGIGIALIDSGVNPGSDLAGRVVYSQDFTGGNGKDQYGHGTHVAGIMAGRGSNSHCSSCTRSLAGMAPQANIINLRVLDQNGVSTDSEVIAAIDTAISLQSKYNIRVINLSLGRPVTESYTSDPLCQAVEAAWNAGIVVVVAAGNDGRVNIANNFGYGMINAPANDPYVITVGAMKTMDTYSRTDDLMASYSSKGPSIIDYVAKPDIVAPGNMIVSTMAGSTSTLAQQLPQNLIPTSYYDSKGNSSKSSSYFMLSGTSMAAGVVSGAVADLLQVQSTLTPDQVKARLMLTSYKTFPNSSTAVDPITGLSYVDYYDVLTRGAGYLDLLAALQSNKTTFGSAASPTVGQSNYGASPQLQFARNSVWPALSPATVWGSSALGSGNVIVSLSNVLSGIGATSASWGTSSAWGTSAELGNLCCLG